MTQLECSTLLANYRLECGQGRLNSKIVARSALEVDTGSRGAIINRPNSTERFSCMSPMHQLSGESI